MRQQAIAENRTVAIAGGVVLAVLMLVGLGFLGYRYAAGLKTTDLGGVVSWGLWIAFYILFIGLSAGSFLLSTLIYVFDMKRYERIGRLALYSAIICLLMGVLFVATDLGHVERAWEVFANISNTSVLWFECMFYIAYTVILLIELYFLTRTDLIRVRDDGSGFRQRLYRFLALGSRRTDPASKRRDMRMVKTLGIIGIPVAVGVHGGTGAVFAVVKAAPHWHSPLLPIVFITSALVSGAALLTFLRAFFFKPDDDEISFLRSLGKLTLGFLAIDWLMVVFEILVVQYGAIPDATHAMHQIFLGDNWWVFWIVQLAIGALLPLYLIIFRGKSRLSLGLGSLAVIIGIVGVRWNIVVPGVSTPKYFGVDHIGQSFFAERLTTSYGPTLVEWMSTIGLVAFFMALIVMGLKYLPLRAEEPTATAKGG